MEPVMRVLLAVFVMASFFWMGNNTLADEVTPKTKPPPSAKKHRPENKVLDFNDDVIEGSTIEPKNEPAGDRKNSPVFVELSKGDTSMDSIVFKRSDFNDFHNVQSKQRVYVQTSSP